MKERVFTGVEPRHTTRYSILSSAQSRWCAKLPQAHYQNKTLSFEILSMSEVLPPDSFHQSRSLWLDLSLL